MAGMSAYLLVALLAQSPTPIAEHVAHIAIASHAIAQAADLSTTEFLLGRGGFREANPVLQWASHDPVPMALVKGGFAVATSWVFLRYHKQHPKLVAVFAFGSTALTGYVAHHNAQLARGAR
jgi:hypothetical protein